MNKSLILVGAVAVAGFITLTAFGGKTKADQLAEIKEKVQMGLESIRSEEKTKCDERVAAAADQKVAELMASQPAPAAPAAKPAKKSTGKGTSAPKLDPAKAPVKADDSKTRGGEVNPENTSKTREGAVPATSTPTEKKRGGAVKTGGN